MNSKEVIILAGGLGTRIEILSNGLPKCLLEIGGRPFLEHLIAQFLSLGAERIILAIANKADQIIDFAIETFSKEIDEGTLIFSEEKIQSGTGGAVINALSKVKSEIFLVSNADTIIPNLSEKIWMNLQTNMNCLVFLSDMSGIRFRYFETDKTHIIGLLPETTNSGKTSSGLVILRKSFLKRLELGPKFSLEEDVLIEQINGLTVGYSMVGEFLDFGVPEDFARARRQYWGNKNSISR